MLYLIGLGLDEGDMTLKAISALEKCDYAYYETFTSDWKGEIKNIEKLAGKKIKMLKREEVEGNFLINEAKENDVALLAPGDPLTATTHFELLLEAKKRKIKTGVIHASSVYTAVAETGLQLYKFGRTTTLPKPQSNFDPKSPIEMIKENKKAGLHSLILLDIGMTAKEGLGVLKENGFDKEEVVVCCHLGNDKKIIKYGALSRLSKDKKLEQSPAVLILPGKLHFKEEEALELWR